jgi:DNA (cytosine-5)-methyltransferase 1
VARCDGQPIAWPEPTHGKGLRKLRTAAECIDWTLPCPSIFERKRPLAEKTQARIAAGVRRFVIENPRPFLVCLTHGDRLEDCDQPLRTTTCAHRGERAVIVPTIIANNTNNRPHSVEEPPRSARSSQGGSKHAPVAAMMTKHYGGVVGHGLEQPIGTVTETDHHALTAVHVEKMYGTSHGQAADVPLHTITGGGQKFAAVAAFLIKFYGQGGQWADLSEPMHTIVSKARFGLVTVNIAGQDYVLADIGMRMLQPRELATANGFRRDYILQGTKEQQVARIGNSVPPPEVEALVRAQFDLDVEDGGDRGEVTEM